MERIYNGHNTGDKFKQRHSVTFDEDTAISTLSVHDVQLEDAGNYECLELYSSQNSLRFDLVVLGE